MSLVLATEMNIFARETEKKYEKIFKSIQKNYEDALSSVEDQNMNYIKQVQITKNDSDEFELNLREKVEDLEEGREMKNTSNAKLSDKSFQELKESQLVLQEMYAAAQKKITQLEKTVAGFQVKESAAIIAEVKIAEGKKKITVLRRENKHLKAENFELRCVSENNRKLLGNLEGIMEAYEEDQYSPFAVERLVC